MSCNNCGTPIGPPIDAEEERENGYVVWFREEYECEACGVHGWIEVEQGGDYIDETKTGAMFA